MARFYTSGIIQSIRGKVGPLIFSNWKGIPVVKGKPKKIRQPNTKLQRNVRVTFGELSMKWKRLSFVQQALWEDYAKQTRTKSHTSVRSRVIKSPRREAMSGMNIYLGVNAMISLSGFPVVEIPPNKSIPKPSFPHSDLSQYSQFKNADIKFRIWLRMANPCKCRARVYIRVIKRDEFPYTAVISEISTIPTEIVINKIRLHDRGKIVEVPVNKIKELELALQMLTIAENGHYSMPSAIYKIKVSNTLSEDKPRRYLTTWLINLRGINPRAT